MIKGVHDMNVAADWRKCKKNTYCLDCSKKCLRENARKMIRIKITYSVENVENHLIKFIQNKIIIIAKL